MISESAHRAPAGALRGAIARYDGYRQRGVRPALHLGAPSPHMTMIVTLTEPMQMVGHLDRSRPPASYDSLIAGLHTTPVVIAHDGFQSGVQLSISPLASRALFGIPACELAGADLAAEDILGRLSGELQERLADSITWPERFAVLDAALGARLRDDPPPQPVINAWALLTRSRGAIPISRLAREVGWSERQLGKRFRQEIGVTPKLAARLIRFDNARRSLRVQQPTDKGMDMARIAADCGYHDQSHLVRDFKSFMGLAPSRWLEQEFGNVQAQPVTQV
jgi:AraC-like DNA-binding protein